MQDKVLLITNATTGVAMATARAASREGYRLVLAADSRSGLEAITQELGPENVVAVEVDATSVQDQAIMIEQALEYFGHIDAIFASPIRESDARGLGSADTDTWQDMLMTHVYSVGIAIQAALPSLRKTQGHILLTGFATGCPVAPGSMYNITRWAITGIGYNLRRELEHSGVRVTMIEPGTAGDSVLDASLDGTLQDRDIANAVSHALAQPLHADVSRILIPPSFHVEN